MKQQMLLLIIMWATFVAILAACGSELTAPDQGQSATASGRPYDTSASAKSLQNASWEVMEAEGLPETYTGAQQVGYLETVAPDGEPIDLQFFESPREAQRELDETKDVESPFDGTREGNVLIFDPAAKRAAVSTENIEALQELLE